MNISLDLDIVLKLTQLTFFLLGIFVLISIINTANKAKKTLEKIETLSGIGLITKLINAAFCKAKKKKAE